MARVSFKIEEIKELVARIKSCESFRLSGNQRFDSELDCLKDGVKKRTEDELPYEDEEIDFTKVKPSFWLVKDEGIYLMGNGILPKDFKVGKDTVKCVYAKNYNPEKDIYWYDMARDNFGGDDFCLDIPFDWFDYLLSKKPNAKVFALNIGERSISLAM